MTSWAIIVVPVVAGVTAVVRWPLLRPQWADVALFAALFVVSGFGVTIGYHRTFAHRALRPRRWLKVVLALAGSTAIEGGPVGWTAVHRAHHKTTDRPGDPHSPVGHGSGALGVLRGFVHAHVGWLLGRGVPTSDPQVADLRADRDLRAIDRLFPLIAAITVVLPLLIGWMTHRSLAGALTAFVWVGLVRVGITQHVTFSINSVCHMVGSRRFVTTDQSRNVWWLAPLTFGESWHNNHHAFPQLARHGVDRRQLDPSARMIRVFERLGWADEVRWPSADRLARKRLVPVRA
ncbi:MAG: acyl-CoA desaturase [Acidimicrobiales bacterium]|nr:acyl-CoA desaturase [Acidimicrobiales bacterium]